MRRREYRNVYQLPLQVQMRGSIHFTRAAADEAAERMVRRWGWRLLYRIVVRWK